MPFDGWNECPEVKDMMAICKYWHEKPNNERRTKPEPENRFLCLNSHRFDSIILK